MLPFESDQADKLQTEIFETIYFASLSSSKDLAKENGHYETFIGSPLSQGLFQYQLWNKKDEDNSGRWDWKKLREEILIFGVRNSLLVAPMPTASTAQILGNNEAFEPFTTNLYTRRTLSGEFVIINKHLIKILLDRKICNSTQEIATKLGINKSAVVEALSLKNLPNETQQVLLNEGVKARKVLRVLVKSTQDKHLKIINDYKKSIEKEQKKESDTFYSVDVHKRAGRNQ
jgi:ribonucleoside-diphosphate reductase alpha chain